MTATRQILVSSALPYANGPLHIGHLLGYIQADIWVRAQRMAGHEVHFVCADDAHGTPIMLAAEKAGVAPDEFIRAVQVEHERDFADFGVAFDFYHSTHSAENREITVGIYEKLRDNGHIARRSIRQLYDPVRSMFLPDRYVKGECPNCGSPDQYGDNCEVCGKAYAPTDLKNPRSVVSGAEPVLREWLDDELRDWDISRDAPYFGFEIPDAPGKYFYVWLDAPIGYLASFKALCASGRKPTLRPESYAAYLDAGSTTELRHFIGKDIVNFHGLFWPAVLHGSGHRMPTALHVNGYLTVNGAKMSKSRGTFIEARTYLDQGLEPEFLRYYFAAKSSGGVDDLDLNLEDFAARVNADLVGKFVNLASRASGFAGKHFGGALDRRFAPGGRDRVDDALAALEPIRRHYRENDFAAVCREAMRVCDLLNQRWDEAKPWLLAKDPARSGELQQVCSECLLGFYVVACALLPILPSLCARALALFERKPDEWDSLAKNLPTRVLEYSPLLTRIDPARIAAMVEASREDLKPSGDAATPAARGKAAAKPPKPAKAEAPLPKDAAAAGNGGHIGIEDFARVDLRVAQVLECEFVEGSDKLLRFRLDAGELGERQIFSGIRAGYPDPAALVGRKVVFIANLAPRKMRFGLSEGMILSAGGDDGLFLLDVDAGAAAGMTVK